MLTLEERQVALEQEQIRLGAMHYEGERVPWQTAASERQEESDSTPGRALVNKYVAPLATAIEIFMQSCANGEAGRKHAAYPYLLHVLPEQAAYLALRGAINAAAGRKKLATESWSGAISWCRTGSWIRVYRETASPPSHKISKAICGLERQMD